MQQLIQTTLLITVLFTSGCDQSPPPDELREGQLFPSLVLPAIDGDDLSLNDLHGRLVILNIWATWCGPCRQELPGLDSINQIMGPENLVVIGLSVDSDRHVAREYLIDRGVSFRSYIDTDLKIVNGLLGIRFYPDTFIISREGVLLRRIVGERQWDHPDIIKALEAAIQGNYSLLEAV